MLRMAAPFVHLRLHSEFSVVDGIVRIDDAVKKAAADGQGALALTDSANLFGAIKFYTAARKRGVKPIIGCDAWITNDAERDNPYRLLLLVQDGRGYANLCELLTRAWLTNQHRGRAELRTDWFEGGAAEGLIALSGAAQGEVGALLLAGRTEPAAQAAQRLAALFPQRFYLEVQRAGREHDEAHVRAALALAVRLALPVVATHPVQFVDRDAFRAHEARVCIAEGYTLADPRRPRVFTPEQYFKTREEMAQLFADVPAALANSVEIARRCNLTLELGTPRLPDYPTPEGVTLDEHCRDLSQQGLQKRLAALYPDPAARAAQRPKYAARLDLELAIIAKMGFSGYFLIVADFINWAKGNGIPVGPGRGSGAGSLVAYSLGITDLDPLRYDLLFERFLNPERVSMPDFDIDFCQDQRDRVIDYVKRKYGAHAVSQVATFGTLGAKAVVRDAGRVLDLPYTKCDQLSKLIPHNPADPWTLERALAEEPAFAEAVNNDEEAAELIELARPLEGLTRNVGMHAGGVLIAPGRLTDFCPLYCAQGTDAVVSQFDKDDVEAIGLVKFDFLGLTTLTILDLALAYVKRLDPASTLTLESIPLDDPKTYEIFKNANTTAIFQFESRGMRDLLKRAKPDRLEDLIALNALYRPGPMDLIPDYTDRKHGRQRVGYLDARMEPILGETYGIMVYQEQVMRIAQAIGGYSLGGADLLRRAMGKKKPEEMAKHRTIFVEGAAKSGVRENVATELFDLMEKFAGYGFNKCVVGATVVQDARTGRRHTVRELFERRRGLDIEVHALDGEWRLRSRRVRDVVWNGRRPVYELRTALGRRLVATDNHPLRALDGWRELRDLKPGDRIAAPRALPVTTRQAWPEHELIALGGLLSEGNTCHPKRVPAGVFALADECIALLLGRMWSGDGFLIGASNTVPYYATSSPGLARDVQDLLLRLGIVARIQSKRFKYRGSSRAGYAVFLLGEDSVRRFVDVVVPHCIGREDRSAELKARCATVAARTSSRDTIPAGVRREVDAARHTTQLAWTQLETASGLSMREFCGAGSAGKRGFRRGTIALLGGVLQSQALIELAESGVYWDTVVEIVPAGVEDVYDLEVDGDHNFVADGLIVHNSHSAAYAVVACQTAYLKAHHPAAFYAANLSAVMDDTDKVKDLVEDAKANGIAVLAPDIKQGQWRFEPVDDGHTTADSRRVAKTIRYGLGGIKGTGRGAIDAIIAARDAGGPFTSLFDLCARVDKHLVNRRVVEALVRAGAFDALDDDRAKLAASVGRALEQAGRAAASRGQASLFGGPAEEAAPALHYVPARRWSERERLANEKLALGYYFSGHLFREYEAEARRLAPMRLADIRQARETVRLAGIIVSSRSQNTRRGRMGVIVLDDATAQVELMVFSELYDRKRALLKEDALVCVNGRVRFDEFNQRLSISADDVMDLAEARARAQAALRIEVEAGASGAATAAQLASVLAPYRVTNGEAAGGCRIVVSYTNGVGCADIPFSEDWRVRPDEALLADLKSQLRVRGARFGYT
jgi:DNA-directed DNA polymerase III PolC